MDTSELKGVALDPATMHNDAAIMGAGETGNPMYLAKKVRTGGPGAPPRADRGHSVS